MIDTEHPVNKAYIAVRKSRLERRKTAGLSTPGPKAGTVDRAKEAEIIKAVERGEDPSPKSNGSLPDIAIPSDLSADLGKYNIDILKSIEQIKGMQVKREKERQELVSRELTQKLFHKIYIVDTNEWKTIGDKLAPDLAAIAGVDDSDIIIKMNQRIEKEVYKILNHTKRIINDFLKGIEAEEIE